LEKYFIQQTQCGIIILVLISKGYIFTTAIYEEQIGLFSKSLILLSTLETGMNEKPVGQKGEKKYLEPTYHYASQLMKIGEDYTTDKITVSELVKAGQLLADFPHFENLCAKGFTKAII
jgi:hypothetical protein